MNRQRNVHSLGRLFSVCRSPLFLHLSLKSLKERRKREKEREKRIMNRPGFPHTFREVPKFYLSVTLLEFHSFNKMNQKQKYN